MTQPETQLANPLRAHCICKALSLTLTAPPTHPNFICHCTLCQRRVGSAFTSLSLFSLTAAKWDNPTKTTPDGIAVPEAYHFVPDHLPTGGLNPSGLGLIECKECGMRIGGYVPKWKSIGVFTSSFERYGEGNLEGKIKGWDVVQPEAHIYYKWRMLDMKDGLKKWEERPGGTEMQE